MLISGKLWYDAVHTPISSFHQTFGSMAKRYHILSIGILCLALTASSSAQVRLDVKTKLAEKKQLTVVKHSVLNAIRSADWVTVADVGEDYSLWLRNLRRGSRGNLITVSMDVELRTRAMIREGRLIDSKRIVIDYNAGEVRHMAAQDDAYGAVRQQLDHSELMHSVAEIAMATMLPGSELFLDGIVSGVIDELNREPTTSELVEGSLISAQVLLSIHSMLGNP